MSVEATLFSSSVAASMPRSVFVARGISTAHSTIAAKAIIAAQMNTACALSLRHFAAEDCASLAAAIFFSSSIASPSFGRGAADDSTMVFGVFDMIYAVLLVISFIFVIVNIVAALMGLKDPNGVTFRKMKRSFGFVLLLLTCVLNVISQILFYISLLTAYPLGAFGFIFMFVLLVAVIVLSGIGMKKTRKVFADEIPVSKK